MMLMRAFKAAQPSLYIERSIGLRNFSKASFMTDYFRPMQSRLSDNMSANSSPLNNDDTSLPQPPAEPCVVPADAGEWPRANYQQIDADEFEDDRVDQTFRELRHDYSSKPMEASDYLKQIRYRCGHIGTKELEIVFRDYLELFGDKMTYAELE
jgi:hypothetical protein